MYQGHLDQHLPGRSSCVGLSVEALPATRCDARLAGPLAARLGHPPVLTGLVGLF
jgi:hypothetical protein